MPGVLLLISKKSEDQHFAEELSSHCRLSLKVVSNAAKGMDIIAQEKPEVIFVDASEEALYQDFENAIQNRFGIFSDMISANRTHYFISTSIEEVNYLTKSPLFGNLLLRSPTQVKNSCLHYSRLVSASLTSKTFGLRELLEPASQIQTVHLESSLQKQSAVDAVREYLEEAGFQSRISALIGNAVDELIMNAIFDAPTDERGKVLLNSTSRDTEIFLNGRQRIQIQVGFDGFHFGVTVSDYFGSLDKNKLMAHITKVYTQEEYVIRNSSAGAGIGLATVLRSGGSFLFMSEAQVQTDVTVFFGYFERYKDFKNQFRFLATQFLF